MIIKDAGTELTTGRRKLTEVIAEYEHKRGEVAQAVDVFKAAGDALKMAATIGGTWANGNISTGNIYAREIEDSLLKSAWRHVYEKYDIKALASADDKRRFALMFEKPPAFTVENLFEHFGALTENPRQTILRGLAEVFITLDPAFKSHEKMKIGVKGLPKRVILNNVGGYGSYGCDRLENMLNALASVQGKPMAEYRDTAALLENGDALIQARGVRLKKYANGNGHLYFEPETLLAVNRGLAEFYGDILPDEAGEKPTKKQASTAVSKDLQYYPTPKEVVAQALSHICLRKGDVVLEPSCGCGRFMDAIRRAGADCLGVEYDTARANIARAKGHAVAGGNFLEYPVGLPVDYVVMNPPFYGRHYQKHVRHAMKFLKPRGVLVAVLPASANYDHGFTKEIGGRWSDLPVASFAESGTNVPTGILQWRNS